MVWLGSLLLVRLRAETEKKPPRSGKNIFWKRKKYRKRKKYHSAREKMLFEAGKNLSDAKKILFAEAGKIPAEAEKIPRKRVKYRKRKKYQVEAEKVPEAGKIPFRSGKNPQPIEIIVNSNNFGCVWHNIRQKIQFVICQDHKYQMSYYQELQLSTVTSVERVSCRDSNPLKMWNCLNISFFPCCRISLCMTGLLSPQKVELRSQSQTYPIRSLLIPYNVCQPGLGNLWSCSCAKFGVRAGSFDSLVILLQCRVWSQGWTHGTLKNQRWWPCRAVANLHMELYRIKGGGRVFRW